MYCCALYCFDFPKLSTVYLHTGKEKRLINKGLKMLRGTRKQGEWAVYYVSELIASEKQETRENRIDIIKITNLTKQKT